MLEYGLRSGITLHFLCDFEGSDALVLPST